ncbi:MAG TPA: thiamine pyrophosphate-dependent dehydrogenase E1 component subunit alpha [Chloroflexia bacterium]|nr:thiamine pyrophosphate-dependent dehydrogenase E1 component subunit alpha [Chloroflexia bacterium]
MVSTAKRQGGSKAAPARPLHEELGLNAETLLDMYYYMVLARKLDERMWQLNRQGKAAFVISCQGQEAAQIGTAFAMERGQDWYVPYYRDLGLMLCLGQTPRMVMLSLFAKAEEPNSGGRQMPGHYGFSKSHVLTTGSPVGTQFLHAAGVGLANKMLRKNSEVVAVFGGEGSTSEGDWHEAMNFASIHKLPVLFIIENNHYAISVPLELQVGGQNLASRAAGYGMPGFGVDGLNPLACYQAVKEACDRARRGDGPTLIEMKCIRITAHSSDDNDRTYRTKEGKEADRQRDPVTVFQQYLSGHGILSEAADATLRARIDAEVEDATDYAEKAAQPVAEDLMKQVYATPEEVAAWRSKL